MGGSGKGGLLVREAEDLRRGPVMPCPGFLTSEINPWFSGHLFQAHMKVDIRNILGCSRLSKMPGTTRISWDFFKRGAQPKKSSSCHCYWERILICLHESSTNYRCFNHSNLLKCPSVQPVPTTESSSLDHFHGLPLLLDQTFFETTTLGCMKIWSHVKNRKNYQPKWQAVGRISAIQDDIYLFVRESFLKR